MYKEDAIFTMETNGYLMKRKEKERRETILKCLMENPGWHSIEEIGEVVGVKHAAASVSVMSILIDLYNQGYLDRKQQPTPEIRFGYRLKCLGREENDHN